MIPFFINDQNQPQIIGPAVFPNVAAPMIIPTLPAPQPEPVIQLPQGYKVLDNQVLPANHPAPLFWVNGEYQKCPSSYELFNGLGERVCPAGFSFVLMDVPIEQIPTVHSTPPSPALSYAPAPSMSRSPDQTPEPSVEPEPRQIHLPMVDEEKPQKNRKFRHRSKQERITQVHEELRVKYTAKGLYAGNDEVLRGFDTVRVHVKTYHALGKIQEPLDEVENHPMIKIDKIATPFSMKNRFQKKGFIVYLKLKHRDMVPFVQAIFARFSEHFAKCDLALKKEDKIALQQAEAAAAQKSLSVPAEKPVSEVWMPTFEIPNMAKRSSLQAA